MILSMLIKDLIMENVNIIEVCMIPLNLPINLFYLLKYFEKKYHSIFTRNDTSLFLHHDEWLENKKDVCKH